MRGKRIPLTAPRQPRLSKRWQEEQRKEDDGDYVYSEAMTSEGERSLRCRIRLPAI